MASQLRMAALSFTDVEHFIRSCQTERAFNGPSFQVINQYLEASSSLLCDLSHYDNPGTESMGSEPKIISLLNLRGITYDKISSRSCEEAFYVAKYLGLNYEESLRVIHLAKSKTHGEISKLQMAKEVFRERNATLQTISLLLSNAASSEISGNMIQLIIDKKFDICTNLIKISKQLLLGFDGNSISDLWENLSRREFEELLQLKNTEDLIYLTNIQRLLTLLLLNVHLPITIVYQWFALLNDTRHKLSTIFNPSFPIANLITTRIESLLTVNTLLILGLSTITSTIDLEAPYYNDVDCFKEISKTLEKDFTNPVILYMWSFVLYAKSFMLEEDPEGELDFVKKAFGKTPISELTASYALRAERGGVFDRIIKISESLSNDKFYAAIITSFLSFSMHFIPLNVQTSKVIKAVLLRTSEEFVEQFLTSSEFEKKLTVLKAKLPLVEEALLPLINISTVHIQFANFEWKNLQTYTCKQKLGELDYDIVDDDSSPLNMDLIVLKKEAFAHPPLELVQTTLIPIPKETRGKLLPTSASNNEEVIAFFYNYNGWAVLGRVLQNIYDLYVGNGNELDEFTKDIMVALIELFSHVVSSKTPIERSKEIIEHVSTYVTDQDIISLIFKIFEHSMHKRNYEVISTCSEFLSLLFTNSQQTVWSHLARSDLLDRYGKTGLATTILGSIELPFGDYTFTLFLIKLADEMVTESLPIEIEFLPKTKMDMLEKLISHLIDISESYQYWKYNDVTQRFELGLLLNRLFVKVLYNVYGIDPLSPPKEKVSSILSGCGSRIIGAFLGSQSPDVPAVNSLLNILLSPQNIQISLLGDQTFGCLYSKLIKCSFELSSLLISIRGLLKMKPSSLEKMIYAKSPNLVDIYASTPSLKRYVIRLFHSLVKVPWSDNYLFLLSYLGAKHSDIFLNSISFDLEAPLANHKLSKDLYKFFSALMESKQDGLSILFLTGSIASNIKHEKVEKDTGNHSILSILKKNALKLDLLPESVGYCLLDSIAYAFNTWANARDSNADTEFVLALLKRVKEFKSDRASSKEDMVAAAGKYKLISCTIEIVALYLFTSAEVDLHFFELLNQPDLPALVNPFFEIDGYNKPLHDDLHKRFEKKWPKLKLSKFTVAPLFQLDLFSLDSIFAISLMDQYFGDDEKWLGSGGDKGYRAEVLEASINLKYVNCQVAAAKAWGALLTTFIRKTDKPLNKTFLDLASNFLKVNIESGIEAPVFSEVYRERLELCFYILYSFQKKSIIIPEKTLFKILGQLIAVFKSEEVGYVGNISRSTKRSFYRPLLRSIILALSFATSGSRFIEMEADLLLEFFEIAFCRGVQLIISEILSDISSSTSSGKQVVIFNMGERIQDLFLLLSLFTKIRSLNPTENFTMIMASSLNEIGTLKVILNLYSSSHLFKVNGEEILGSLVLTFVSELCTIDQVATKFITNGLFATLLESPLSVAIQEGNIKPEQNASLHSIWSNGLLSIILLLLSKFGTKVLPECCLFLSYFSQQVETAVFRWSDSRLAVSTALIRESTQLVLLQKILHSLNYQQYLTNSNVISSSREDHIEIELVVGLDSDRERKALSVALNRLLTHPKYLNSRIVATTIEEQRLLEDENTRGDFVRHISKKIKELQYSLFSE